MCVLMVSWEYPPHIVGGLGTHVADLSPALVAEGQRVYILTPMLRGGEPSEITADGVHVVRVAVPPQDHHSFTAFVALANQQIEQAAVRLAQEVGGFDLIHTHDWLTATSAIALKQRWHVPLVATIHATERGRGRGALNGDQALHIDSLEWQLTYEAWRIIVCSHFMLKQLVESFHLPYDKIDVVPNGTDIRPSPFQNEDERLTFRRRFASDDEHIVFYVGRIVYEKGLHVLLDAWPQVLRQVRAHLVIAGTGSYLSSLQAQASAMGIDSSVTFTGFISDHDRDGLYHVADVTTFPSLYEPFGIVVLEAYAAGSPVVVGQTGGLMEVVHEATGITVVPGNAESLADGILTTIQEREATSKRVANAFQELRELYNWRTIACATIRVYERVYHECAASDWGSQRSTPLRPSEEELRWLAS